MPGLSIDRAGLFLSSEYYLDTNPDVADAINNGDFASPLEHFFNFGIDEQRPANAALESFDAEAYLAANQDVATAIDNGAFDSALDHFLTFGINEDRAGTGFDFFDAESYLTANEDVAGAVEGGDFASALEHYLLYGYAEERPGVSAPTSETFEVLASSDFVNEGDTLTFAVVTEGRSAVENDTEVEISLGDGIDADDIEGELSRTATIGAGEIGTTFSFDIANDGTPEGLENLVASISIDGNPVTATASALINDTSTLPDFTVEDLSQSESETTFEFAVSTDSAFSGTLNYDVLAVGSDFTTPADFADGVNPTGTVEITDGEGTISFEVANDEVFEGDETFQVIVSPEDSAETLATATGTIENDDFPDVTVEDLAQSESETTFEFAVTTDSAFSGTLNYDVLAVGSDFTTPDDFANGVNPTGTVEITDGEGTISFEVANDEVFEGDETFQVIVSPEDSAETLATATGTIENDDFPDVTVEDLAQSESETTFEFTVTTDSAFSGPLNYDVLAVGSDFTTPADFADGVNPTGTVNITDGEGTISFEVENDNEIEGNETFQVIVSPEDSAETLATATGTIENDDVLEGTTFSVGDVFQSESESTFEFDVTTDPSITGTFDYDVVATGSEPTIPDDFAGGVNPTGTFDIVNGRGSVSIDVENDDIAELDETFQLIITPEGSEGEGVDDVLATATGIIDNDDGPIV
ncbi:MAG: hypothetical protein RI580_01960 [Halothece sp. Uz-M2-17]|nr:hypothetical protein [Halothece sp. Uz-M2-17]